MNRAAALLFVLVLTIAVVPCGIAAEDAERFSKSGIQTLVAGDAQQAVELLSRAISLNPSVHRYYNDRGVALKRLGKLDEAISDYTRALEIKPDFTSSFNNRGVAYLEKGMYDKAVKDFSKALEFGDLTSKVYTNRGLAYSLMGEQNKALEDFKKAISVRPVDSRAFVLSGDLLLKSGDKVKAFQMYQLGAGLVKDPKMSREIEAKLAALENGIFTAQSLQGPKPSGNNQRAQKDQAGKTSRGAAHGREVTAPQSAPDHRPLAAGALYTSARENIMKRLPPEAAQLYRRGDEYLSKSDAPKALLMYEDAQQLAKRHRDKTAEAWTLVEIGRVHAALGDQFVGSRYVERAIESFERLKAADEKAAAIAELASIRKPGGPDRISTPPLPERKPVAANDRPKAPAAVSIAPRPHEQSPLPTVSVPHKQPAAPVKAIERKVAAAPDVKPTSEEMPAASAKPTPPSLSETKQPEPTVLSKLPAKRSRQADRQREDVIRQILRASKAQPVETSPGTQSQVAARPERPEPPLPEHKSIAVERVAEPVRVERTSDPPKARKSIEELLTDLRRLKAAGDERGMIATLELLASEFDKKGKPDRALLCMDASIAFRDKLGMTDGIDKVLLLAGTLKEKTGRLEDALADYTRGLATAQKEKKTDLEKTLKQRSESLVKKVGLETEAALDQFAALWTARGDGDEESETRALHRVAGLYERAGRSAAAAEYYARTAALLAAQRGSLLKKAGKPAEAEESMNQALGEFKRLDYSRYLLIMKKSKELGPISRHE
ncbi:MAG: tetratricopeptide repeat protein [Desulfomonile sp.]|nr:tetratricopeptide repeat protein [Desulfomonile sp.]